MDVTPRQAERLRRAHSEITTVLAELGVLDDAGQPAEPRQHADQSRRWRLLNAVAQRGGRVGASEWSRLGRTHGYDPRGLGGFFRGAQPVMEHDGHRRILTASGHRFVERWRADFETQRAASPDGGVVPGPSVAGRRQDPGPSGAGQAGEPPTSVTDPVRDANHQHGPSDDDR